MKKYQKHIFICEKDDKNSCGGAGSFKIRKKLKSRLKELNLSKSIRANSSGCLGQCKHGPVAVVYPEGIWYKGLREEDVETIIQKHLVGNKPVKGLLLSDDDSERKK
ncbi:MAG: (2Fe-2S) ferredoxin domain-containing protein [Bacteroidota bacterium]